MTLPTSGQGSQDGRGRKKRLLLEVSEEKEMRKACATLSHMVSSLTCDTRVRDTFHAGAACAATLSDAALLLLLPLLLSIPVLLELFNNH